jgi:nitrogen fixation-related uncharacterized protein
MTALTNGLVLFLPVVLMAVFLIVETFWRFK